MIGSIGNYWPSDATGASNCEIQIRRGTDLILRTRYFNHADNPKILNLGAGVIADGDTWIGIRSYAGEGAGPGCEYPAYWTAISSSVFRPGRG